MFKMGGSSGTGITSGLDRQNYQVGGGADARRFGLRPMPMPRVGGGAVCSGVGLGVIDCWNCAGYPPNNPVT